MKLFIKTIIVFCALTVSAHAKPYFDSKTVSPISLTPPFEKDSKAWNDEIEQIAQLQKNADKNEVAKAKAEKHVELEIMIADIDKKLTRQNNPKLFAMLDRVSQTTKSVTDSAKVYWRTKRPFLASTKVKALIPANYGYAYPSGHTCFSFTIAQVMSEVFPDKKEILFQKAEEIAQHRVLVGMHYPSDIDGGKELSGLISAALQKNPEFLADMKAAQMEATTLYSAN